jgi:uncharacterized protein (TIGR02145 family)
MAATEIYNNFNLKAKKALDAKLTPVSNVAALADPNVASNFLYEGATVWVISEKRAYVVENQSETLVWVPTTSGDKVLGQINLLSTSTHLDLSVSQPAIENCWGVVINIVGVDAPILSTVENIPAGELITLFAQAGRSLTVKHTEIEDANPNDIVLELGANMILRGRSVATERLILFNDNGVNTQYGAVQFAKLDDFTSLIGQAFTTQVIDNLTTASSTLALSARMGVTLKALVDTKNPILIPGLGLGKTPNINGTETLNLNLNYYTQNPAPGQAVPNIDSYLTGRSLSNTHNQIINLTAFGQGSYLLPRGADPANISSWITLILPTDNTVPEPAAYLKATQIFSGENQVYIPVGLDGIYNPTFNKPNLLIDTVTGTRFNVNNGSDLVINSGTRKIKCLIRLTLPMGASGSLNPNILGRTWVEHAYITNQQVDLNFGYLYNGYAIPTLVSDTLGWRVPTSQDFTDLVTNEANLKTAGTTDWGVGNGSTNAVNFSALPGGSRTGAGVFEGKDSTGRWWCSDLVGSNRTARTLVTANNTLGAANLAQNLGSYVRLVRDITDAEEFGYAEGEIIPKVYFDTDGNHYNGVRVNRQIWLTEDLRTTVDADNLAIPEITDGTAWGAATTAAWSSYNNDPIDSTLYTLPINIYNPGGQIGFSIYHQPGFSSTRSERFRAVSTVDPKSRFITVTFTGVFTGSELVDVTNQARLNFINTTALPVYGGFSPNTEGGTNTIQEQGKLEVILEELL